MTDEELQEGLELFERFRKTRPLEFLVADYMKIHKHADRHYHSALLELSQLREVQRSNKQRARENIARKKLYPVDLNLRLRVAQAAQPEWKWVAGYNAVLGTLGNPEYPDDCGAAPEYEISFDAIMPLVRALPEKEAAQVVAELMIPHIATFYHNPERFPALCAIPADYCRAYLAVKGKRK